MRHVSASPVPQGLTGNGQEGASPECFDVGQQMVLEQLLSTDVWL
jgi:hypothetical protein